MQDIKLYMMDSSYFRVSAFWIYLNVINNAYVRDTDAITVNFNEMVDDSFDNRANDGIVMMRPGKRT